MGPVGSSRDGGVFESMSTSDSLAAGPGGSAVTGAFSFFRINLCVSGSCGKLL